MCAKRFPLCLQIHWCQQARGESKREKCWYRGQREVFWVLARSQRVSWLGTKSGFRINRYLYAQNETTECLNPLQSGLNQPVREVGVLRGGFGGWVFFLVELEEFLFQHGLINSFYCGGFNLYYCIPLWFISLWHSACFILLLCKCYWFGFTLIWCSNKNGKYVKLLCVSPTLFCLNLGSGRRPFLKGTPLVMFLSICIFY